MKTGDQILDRVLKMVLQCVPGGVVYRPVGDDASTLLIDGDNRSDQLGLDQVRALQLLAGDDNDH